MNIERAAFFIKEILDAQIKNNNLKINKSLSNWELDFIATICRIGASGKMSDLSESQAKSLAATYFRHVLLNKCQLVIRNSEYKCENCNEGVTVDSNNIPERCNKCNGNGYTKEEPKPKEYRCLNCNNGMIEDKEGSHTCHICSGTGFVKTKPKINIPK